MFITNTSHHTDFVHLAEHLNNLQYKYDAAKDSALLLRMEMIGVSEDYKRNHSQRSAEARYIQKGYDANGWNKDVVYMSYKAYRCQQHLLENVNPEFRNVSKLASFSQLYQLANSDDNRIIYDTAMFLKKNNTLPSVSKLKGYKAGFLTTDFQSKASIAAEKNKQEQEDTPKPQYLPDTPAHEKIVTAHEQRQAELIVNGVDWVREPSELEQALKLVQDYPDIVQLIQSKLDAR